MRVMRNKNNRFNSMGDLAKAGLYTLAAFGVVVLVFIATYLSASISN